jgi:hypothetical protein
MNMEPVDTGELKERLLGCKRRQEIVLDAIRSYNHGLATVRDWLAKNPGQEHSKVKRAVQALDRRIEVLQQQLENMPSNTVVRRDLSKKRSGKLLLENLLLRLNGGASVESVLAPLPDPGRVRNYDHAFSFLQQNGLLVRVDDRSDLCRAIRDAADYQVVLLGRKFEIPAPFSQKLIKFPRISNDAAFRMALGELVESRIKEKYGRKVSLDVIYFDRKDSRYEAARRDAARLFKSADLRRSAEGIVSDLVEVEPVYLLPRDKRKDQFMRERRIPEAEYARAFAGLSSGKDYFTITFRGFDIHHPKVILTTNNSVGMRMHLYSESLDALVKAGFELDVSDITEIDKPLAHGCDGKVMSVSGVEKNYKTVITHVSDFRQPVPPEAYALWVDAFGYCRCDDQTFVGKLHSSTAYDFSYFCKHVVELYCAYASNARKQGLSVLSPLPFPLDEQIEFERRVARQVLVVRKEDGKVKEKLNRGEREWLNLANAVERGFARTYTTDFSAAKAAMKRMYLGE